MFIAGYSDTVGLWRRSKTLASSVRNHIVLDVLIALGKCGLLALERNTVSRRPPWPESTPCNLKRRWST